MDEIAGVPEIITGLDARFHRTMIKSGDNVFFLSDRERYACEVMLQCGGNLAHTARMLEKQFKRPLAPGTLSRWMARKPQIKAYMHRRVTELIEYNDLTKEGYFHLIEGLAKSDAKVRGTTFQFWKLVGEIKGFLGERGEGVQINQTFQVVQANGER